MLKQLVLALLALALVAAPAAASMPPCTCDPNPITDLLRCSLTDGTTPPPEDCEDLVETSDLPEPDVKGTIEELDPRNWPCTCDPMPEPW